SSSSSSSRVDGGVDELAYWKRRGGQGCGYGGDLNPLAGGLGELLLWGGQAGGGGAPSGPGPHPRRGGGRGGASAARAPRRGEGGARRRGRGEGGRRKQKGAGGAGGGGFRAVDLGDGQRLHAEHDAGGREHVADRGERGGHGGGREGAGAAVRDGAGGVHPEV